MNLKKCFIRRLYPYIKLNEQILIVCIILLTTIFGLLVPQIIRVIIDEVIYKQNYKILTVVGTVLLIVTIIISFLEYFQAFILCRISEKVSRKIRMEIYEKLIKLNYKARAAINTGTIISIFNNDVSQLYGFISTFISGVIAQGIVLIVLILTMISISVKLTFLSILTVPIYFLFFSFLANKLRRYAEKRQAILSSLNNTLQEDILGMNIIQSFLAQEEKKNFFYNLLNNMFSNNINLSIINSLLSQVASLVAGLGNVVVLWFGAKMILNHEITTGQLIAYTSYIGRLYAPILSLVSMNQTLQSIFPSFKRVFGFLDYETEEDDRGVSKTLFDKEFNIRMEDIDVDDCKGNKILNKINMEINHGKFVAIVGESGAGKTTIGNLINKMITPSEGKIFINEVEYNNFSAEELRKKIGMVSQEGIIFSCSIKENLTLLKQGYTDEQLKKVIEDLNCNFVDNFSNGINAMLGSKGYTLSTGEKQRIYLARAFLRNYDVLFLDEPTSSLDNVNSAKFINRIMNERKGKTTVLVSHKLDDVKVADLIYVINDGKIVGYGTHEQLLLNCDYYKKLYYRQIEKFSQNLSV